MPPSQMRSRGSWKGSTQFSEPDRWLDEKGYFRKHIARDPSSLFRIVSENIHNTQRYFSCVRMQCVNFMASKREMFERFIKGSFEHHLKEMSNPTEPGGLIEISAMSYLYRYDFVVFESIEGPETTIGNGYDNVIYLYYSADSKHFDAVYHKSFITNSSFCQSLVYELLYETVFNLKDLSNAVDTMLHDTINHCDYFMAENVERRKCQAERNENNALLAEFDKNYFSDHIGDDSASPHTFEDSLNVSGLPVESKVIPNSKEMVIQGINFHNAKNLLDHGIIPFPYKVAKALDPDMYRNIEFDVWKEMRREIRYGSLYADGLTLQVGVKCLCRLQLDQKIPYHCHIQEMKTQSGPCLVFIEELGQKRYVTYEQLEPLSAEDARPWAPSYRQSRNHPYYLALNQMLQQLGQRKPKSNPKQGNSKLKAITPVEHNTPWIDENNKLGLQEELKNEDSNKMLWETVPEHMNYSNCYLDYYAFQPYPVDFIAMIVDCHTGTGGTGQLPPRPDSNHNNQNGSPNEHSPPLQMGSSTDMGSNQLTPPSTVGASTPAATPPMPPGYAVSSPFCGTAGVVAPGAPFMVYGAPAPYCPPPPAPQPTHKPLLLCAPVAPPPNVNCNVAKSVQPNGSDLPMNDIPTLRYFFNLGIECMWGSNPLPSLPAPREPINELAQELQQVSMHERPQSNSQAADANKHKPPAHSHSHTHATHTHVTHAHPPHAHATHYALDKSNMRRDNNAPRGPLGPRFKRSGVGEGAGGGGGMNKNNGGSKGCSRRNNYADNRNHGVGVASGGVGAEGEGGVVPFLPYPPPPPPFYTYGAPYYQMEGEAPLLGYLPPPPPYLTYEELPMGGEAWAVPPPQYVGYGPPAYYAAPHPHMLPQYALPPPPHAGPPASHAPPPRDNATDSFKTLSP